MAQTIKMQVEFIIPPDQVLISKIEYERLQDADSYGRTCSLEKFAELLGKSERWAKDNLLQNAVFKRKLDEKNGGFVHYPKGPGDPYSFLEDEARKFIKDNFGRIFK